MIKNIILDLGGVIIDLDTSRTANAFKRAGLVRFDEIYSQKKQEHLFDKLDKGLISEEFFVDEIKKYFVAPVSTTQVLDAWNAMLLDIPPHRMEFILSLKKSYRLFLLSNTNSIHIKAFTEKAVLTYGHNIFNTTFDKIYYSNEIGMRKPDPEIFCHVLMENSLDKKETIFIDDSLQHIEGATKAGLNAFHLDLSKDKLETFLSPLLKSLNN